MAYLKRALSSLLAALLVTSLVTVPAGARETVKDLSENGDYRASVRYLRADETAKSPSAKMFDQKVDISVTDGDATLVLKAHSNSVKEIEYRASSQSFAATAAEWSGPIRMAKHSGSEFSIELPYGSKVDPCLYLEATIDGVDQADDAARFIRVEVKYGKLSYLGDPNAPEEEAVPPKEDEPSDSVKEQPIDEGVPTEESKSTPAPGASTSDEGSLDTPVTMSKKAQVALSSSDGEDTEVFAMAKLNKDKLEDGTYEVKTAVYHAYRNEPSMCDGVFVDTARIAVKNGKYTVYMYSHPMQQPFGDKTITASLNKFTVQGSDVKVISRDSAGDIASFSFPLSKTSEFIPAVVTPSAPGFSLMDGKDIEVRIKIDYSTLTQISSSTKVSGTPKNTKAKKTLKLSDKTSLADKAKGTSLPIAGKGNTPKTGDNPLTVNALAMTVSLSAAIFVVLSILDARKRRVLN